MTYRPPGPVAEAFLDSTAFVCGIRGPIGSGKSTACVVKTLLHAHAQPRGPSGKRRSRYAVIRNTYPELRTTTVKTWEQWAPKECGDWNEQGPMAHRIVNDEIDMEVWFVALDRPQDVAKLLSMELTGAWVNEAREVPKPIIDGLTGRVGRFPPVREGGCFQPQVWMDTNPPDTDHWWYQLAEEDTPEGFAFFSQPGGKSGGAENLENLPAGYYDRAALGKDEEWVRVYIDGDYGFVREGKPVYPEYRDGVHCREFGLLRGLPVLIGLDFGLTPAAVFGQRTATGQWRWHSELVTQDTGIYRFSELLKPHIAEHYAGCKIGAITGDPAGDARSATDRQERTTFEILRSLGIPAAPALSNDWTKRREAVAVPLSRLIDGQPGLLVHPQCRVLRKGMSGGYAYRRIQIGGSERYTDRPDKNMYSHVCEAGQYLNLGGGEWKSVLNRPPRARNIPALRPRDSGMGY